MKTKTSLFSLSKKRFKYKELDAHTVVERAGDTGFKLSLQELLPEEHCNKKKCIVFPMEQELFYIFTHINYISPH